MKRLPLTVTGHTLPGFDVLALRKVCHEIWIRHRQSQVHRLPLVHGGLQDGKPRPAGRKPDVGQVRGKGEVSTGQTCFSSYAMQSLRKAALR